MTTESKCPFSGAASPIANTVAGTHGAMQTGGPINLISKILHQHKPQLLTQWVKTFDYAEGI